MKSLLMVFVLFGAWLSVALGAVSFGPIMIEKQYGKDVKYCQYGGLKLLPGSKIKNLETCERCRCRRSGLNCQSMAATFKATGESKCQYVWVGCKGRWVKNKNTSRRCRRKDIPTEVVGVGK